VQVHVRARERLGPRVHVADRARRVRAERVCRAGDGRVDRRETGRRWADDARCGGARLGAWHSSRERRHRCVRVFLAFHLPFLFFNFMPVMLADMFLTCDSYAGWLGTIAARHEEEGDVSPAVSLHESSNRLAAVAGTSTCHLVQVHGSNYSRRLIPVYSPPS